MCNVLIIICLNRLDCMRNDLAAVWCNLLASFPKLRYLCIRKQST